MYNKFVYLNKVFAQNGLDVLYILTYKSEIWEWNYVSKEGLRHIGEINIQG